MVQILLNLNTTTLRGAIIYSASAHTVYEVFSMTPLARSRRKADRNSKPENTVVRSAGSKCVLASGVGRAVDMTHRETQAVGAERYGAVDFRPYDDLGLAGTVVVRLRSATLAYMPVVLKSLGLVP